MEGDNAVPVDEIEAIVQRLGRGDATAREEFARLCWTEARRIAERRLGQKLRQRLDVEDVVQSSLRRVTEDMGSFSFQSHRAWYEWLRAIVEHTIIDAERRLFCQKREPPTMPVSFSGLASSSDGDAQVPCSGLPEPSAEAGEREELALLLRAIGGLPEDYRMVLKLRCFDGLSIVEIAHELGRTEKAIEHLLARARKAVEENRTGR